MPVLDKIIEKDVIIIQRIGGCYLSELSSELLILTK